MAIEIVSAEDAKAGRGGKTKGEKYTKYGKAIQKSIPWIEAEIGKSKDKMIRVRNEDIRKEMGGEFVKKSATSVYWGLKYVLFQDGIVVDTGTHKTGDKLLVFRFANEEDRLPPSLSKYLETGEEPGDETDEAGTDDESEDK